jgi:MYXO-CTERM domain-containing protein
VNANGHRHAPTEPQALRAEIAQTRAELGETVSALAAKADVKARAQQFRGDLTGRVKDSAGELRQRLSSPSSWPVMGAVAALTLLLIGLASRRRRR